MPENESIIKKPVAGVAWLLGLHCWEQVGFFVLTGCFTAAWI